MVYLLVIIILIVVVVVVIIIIVVVVVVVVWTLDLKVMEMVISNFDASLMFSIPLYAYPSVFLLYLLSVASNLKLFNTNSIHRGYN